MTAIPRESVLVLDGDSREAVAIVRSLGRHGVEVNLATERKLVAAAFSKYVLRVLLCPSPTTDGFLPWLREILANGETKALISIRDRTTRFIVEHSRELAGLCGTAVPGAKAYATASDKLETIRLAQELRIPAPKTLLTRPVDEKEVERTIGFPCVIKPRFSSGSRGIGYVSNAEDFLKKYDAIVSSYGDSIVQERIPRQGTAFGVSMLFNKGRPMAIFAHRRLREYPSTGGPSTLRVSVRRPDIERFATVLLSALEWHGVAMVEFKVDPRDGIPKLMEINPRFWGSLQLGISSGVDFPMLLYKLITHGEVEPTLDYAIGVKCRWFLFGDILWYISSEGKIRNLREFLRFKEKNLFYDIASLDDFGPVIGSCADAFTSLLDKQRREHVLKRGV